LIIALRGVLWGLLRASAPILCPSVLREAFSSFRRHLMRQTLWCELGPDHRDSYPIPTTDRARRARTLCS